MFSFFHGKIYHHWTIAPKTLPYEYCYWVVISETMTLETLKRKRTNVYAQIKSNFGEKDVGGEKERGKVGGEMRGGKVGGKKKRNEIKRRLFTTPDEDLVTGSKRYVFIMSPF